MKILCIDDDSGVLIFLKAALSKDHDVTTANCGEEGLAAFRKQGPFSIVISDIQMPDITGFDVVKQIKAESKDTVCMLITGQADFDCSHAAVKGGDAEKCLLKPLVLKTFRETMEECIELVEQRELSS